ncbi:MAG: OmpA family protein [Bacteroidetes bacterium]|nr:OmpA family protein [Bacteroidota bacterium]
MNVLYNYLILSQIFLYSYSCAQNLIPNPGFEDHDKCLGLNTRISVWSMPSNNFYHYLCDCPVPKAQYNGEEKNKAHEGKGISGICLYGREAGEYMMVKLTQALVANTEYYFSGYVLLADEKKDNYENFKQLEIGFSGKDFSVTNPSYIFFDPQLLIPVSFASKEKEWIFISGRFTASGNETNLIIGNFLPSTPIADELTEYMSLSQSDRESYLRKHKKLADAMNEFNSEVIQESRPYSIRCYFDDLCLMQVSDSLKGYCNYPVTKNSSPEIKPEVNKPIVLENIFFETAKSTLLPSSFESLNNLGDWLKKNPSAEIQISGHTDNKGNEEENKKLSFDRAKSVKEYLASKNAVNKIEINGFGSTNPIASNDSEEGRSKNRRVEFVIIKQ